MNRERLLVALTPRRILVGGWLVFMLYAFPGYLQADGVEQLLDSRYGQFSDRHSVVMTQLWRVVGIFITGPAGMLTLQSLLFLLGAYSLLRRELTDRWAAIATICLILFPPIMAALAVVSAHVQLVGFLLAATAALASERPAWRWAGLGLAVIACGMRDGASLAAFPIVVALFRWRDSTRRSHRLAIAVTAWLIVVLAAAALDWALVDVPTDRRKVELAMTDIVGTLRYANDLPDDKVRPLLDGVPLAQPTDIQQRARAVYGRELFYAATDVRVFEPPASDAEREAFYAARLAFMRAHPGAYLDHRLHQLYRALGFSTSRSWNPAYTSFVPTYPRDSYYLAHAARHSAVQEWLVRPVTALGSTFIFRPFVYFFLAIVLLPFAVVRKAKIATCLLASGLVYELSLTFLSTRLMYLDSLWMIAATGVGFALLVGRKRS